MSLKNRLLSNKSSDLTKWKGTNPNINAGATKASLLHADGGNENMVTLLVVSTLIL